MKIEKIKSKLEQLLEDKFGLENCREDRSLIHEYDLDSLDMIELAMEIENEFNITISDEQLETCSTMKHFIDLIDNKTKDIE